MGKKIVAVDDDPVIIEMIHSGLARKGYEVRIAKDGREAMTLVDEERPDLIILDIMMPQMDGTEVARALKENETTRHIPIIFLTVLWENEDPTMDKSEFGANVVLGKPFRLEELLEKMEALLGAA